MIAEDHALVREGIRRMIESDPTMEVAAEASSGDEALDLASHADLDLLVLDVLMPVMTGIQVARELQRRHVSTPILFLTGSSREEHLRAALQAKAIGYVHKSVAGDEFLQACHKVIRGEPVLYPGAVQALINDYLNVVGQRQTMLSEREEQVLKLIAEGRTSKDIAGLLYISPKTVERHRARLLDKLGARDRLDLCRYAIRAGLIEA